MSSRVTQLLLGLSLLLNCFVLAGFVYRTWIEPPPVVREARPAPPRGGPLEMLAQDVKLDDGQRAALKDLFDRYADERRQRIHEIQKLREAMGEELKKSQFDMNRIDALVDQMTSLRADLQKQSLAAIAQFADRVRPDQRQQLQTILAERFGGWRPPSSGNSQRSGTAPARSPQ